MRGGVYSSPLLGSLLLCWSLLCYRQSDMESWRMALPAPRWWGGCWWPSTLLHTSFFLQHRLVWGYLVWSLSSCWATALSPHLGIAAPPFLCITLEYCWGVYWLSTPPVSSSIPLSWPSWEGLRAFQDAILPPSLSVPSPSCYSPSCSLPQGAGRE